MQLPRDRPLWKFTCIHNPEGGGSRLLLRIHHVIADGAGLAVWFHSLCEPVSRPATPESNGRGSPGSPPSPPSKSSSEPAPPTAVAENPGTVRKIWAVVGFCILKVWLIFLGLLKLLFITRDSNSPFKGPKTGRKLTATTKGLLDLTVSEVKAVGKAYDQSITVNDVVSTLLAGAFRRFFESCYLHPDEMTMRLSVPMNMRIRPDPIDMDNQFSLVFKGLPIHLPTIQVTPQLCNARAYRAFK